ncbi:hypothetical protein C0971_10940 [Bacillus methanolicus]|uniref:hypothetical protein n=1 Tax=Bacillus methanolicus TaxID=1471 RepID=UPI00200D67D5|nr:hypothetical protein [Bacillus methanolicus]UQD52471.1 hypothetical protein C0971_10940 [Bacillus methanolicus]
MFDPTAFENMKVVIEGAVYDLDLSGEIRVIDRNDLINTAKLSREFNISFTKAGEYQPQKVIAKFMMEAKLENLAAELLPDAQSVKLSGSNVMIVFIAEHENDKGINKKLLKTVKEIWGENRSVAQKIIIDPSADNEMVKSETSVSFNRLVSEEQIDDLAEMIPFMLQTLKELSTIVS